MYLQIKSSLVGEFICSKCIKRIRNFINFIETCLTVEKFLVEEDIKNERKIASEQANSELQSITICVLLKNLDFKHNNIMYYISIEIFM